MQQVVVIQISVRAPEGATYRADVYRLRRTLDLPVQLQAGARIELEVQPGTRAMYLVETSEFYRNQDGTYRAEFPVRNHTATSVLPTRPEFEEAGWELVIQTHSH